MSLEIDPGRRLARVEPGVVLDDLRRATERHGLTFGPDPATHAWCTVGGMIGNNSCGTHGLYAGKTSDNVDRLRVVLAGGEALEVGPYGADALSEAVASGGPSGPVARGAPGSGTTVRALVRSASRSSLAVSAATTWTSWRPQRGFHVARALVGTESTCAFTTEATLRLVTSPAERCLVALGYPDVFAAAEAVPELLAHPLLALEGFDRTLVDQMEAHRLNSDGVALLPPGNGWLLAELGGETADEATSLAAELVASLPAGVSARQVGMTWPPNASFGRYGSRASAPRPSASTATTTTRGGRTGRSPRPGWPSTCAG